MFRGKTPPAEKEEKITRLDLSRSHSLSVQEEEGEEEEPGTAPLSPAENDRKLSSNLRIQPVRLKSDAVSDKQQTVMASLSEFRRGVVLAEDVLVKATLTVVPVPGRQTERPPAFDVVLRLLGRESSKLIAENHVGMTETILKKLSVAACDIVTLTVTESSIQVRSFSVSSL